MKKNVCFSFLAIMLAFGLIGCEPIVPNNKDVTAIKDVTVIIENQSIGYDCLIVNIDGVFDDKAIPRGQSRTFIVNSDGSDTFNVHASVADAFLIAPVILKREPGLTTVVFYTPENSLCRLKIKNDQKFNEKTEIRIRQDAFDTYIKPYPETFIGVTVNDIWISHYFGTYNDSVVVMINGWLGYDMGFLHYTVADVSFEWTMHQFPHVWKDGKFHHGLQEAYDAGWLTKNDLEEIAVRHNIWWQLN